MIFKKKVFEVQAKNLYSAIIDAFEGQKWEFNRNDEVHLISTMFDTATMPIALCVKAEDNFINFRGFLAFKVEKRDNVAILSKLNEINDGLLFGSFRMDVEDGYLTFNYSMICADAVPSATSIAAVISMVLETVDDYDDTLKAIATMTDSIPDHMYG